MKHLEEIAVVNKIVAEVSADSLTRELAGISHGSLKYLWTRSELPLIQDYLPSSYFRIARELNHGIRRFEDRRINLAFQFQSELIIQFSTLDAGIIHGRRDSGSVGSKIHNLGRVYKIARVLGIETPEFIPDSVLNSGDLDEILIQAKLRYSEILKNLPNWMDYALTLSKTTSLSEEEKVKFQYAQEIANFLEGDLVAMALYGSASREEDPEKYSDYDNYAVVKDGSLLRVYQKLKDTKPVHSDGKSIGLNLVEESLFTKCMRLTHEPNEHLLSTKMLYGTLDFPVVSNSEAYERAISYSMIRAKCLRSACSWITADPQKILDKEALFDYFQKMQLFILETGLNISEGELPRSKDKMKERLRDFNGEVMPFVPEPEYLVRTTYKATAITSKIIETLYSGVKFRNGFMKVA